MTDAAQATPDRPVHLDDGDDLDALVADHDRVLVEFHSNGCPKCQAIEPLLGNVARATDVAVGTMNPRDDPPLVHEYDVRSLPLFLLFEDGDVVARTPEAFQATEDIVEFVENQGNT